MCQDNREMRVGRKERDGEGGRGGEGGREGGRESATEEVIFTLVTACRRC
ncbi:MAG: hypothetical protein MJE68_05010 [Proteobacteria bacterium]|nr:hypothetical protein [Pseudomonadota bacterium]